MRRHLICLLWVCVLAAAMPSVLMANDLRALQIVQQSPQIGADQAAAIVRDRTGGRVLNVRPTAESGRAGYAVKILLNEGRVRTVVIDAKSGRER